MFSTNSGAIRSQTYEKSALEQPISRYDSHSQSASSMPGVLHHVIGRGIEGREIFTDDLDRDDFISRLSLLLAETQTLMS